MNVEAAGTDFQMRGCEFYWGGTTGYFSRTAHIRGKTATTSVEDAEPAPDIVGVVYGRLITIPDGSGDWVTTDTFSDDPAAMIAERAVLA